MLKFSIASIYAVNGLCINWYTWVTKHIMSGHVKVAHQQEYKTQGPCYDFPSWAASLWFKMLRVAKCLESPCLLLIQLWLQKSDVICKGLSS